MQIAIGQIVQLKKKHPCGGDRWRVTRVGADVKIKCDKCGRVVMLGVEEFKKAIKQPRRD